MKPADLHKVWSAPDNSRLTGKQQSFRLPVHVAAKIQALCDIFPNKTKTEIVGDLLATALEEVIENLPVSAGVPRGADDQGRPYFDEEGTRAQFRTYANKYYRELEKELGNKEVTDLYSNNYMVFESDLGPSK